MTFALGNYENRVLSSARLRAGKARGRDVRVKNNFKPSRDNTRRAADQPEGTDSLTAGQPSLLENSQFSRTRTTLINSPTR
jgi:hypothetical protein